MDGLISDYPVRVGSVRAELDERGAIEGFKDGNHGSMPLNQVEFITFVTVTFRNRKRDVPCYGMMILNIDMCYRLHGLLMYKHLSSCSEVLCLHINFFNMAIIRRSQKQNN